MSAKRKVYRVLGGGGVSTGVHDTANEDDDAENGEWDAGICDKKGPSKATVARHSREIVERNKWQANDEGCGDEGEEGTERPEEKRAQGSERGERGESAMYSGGWELEGQARGCEKVEG